jgi:drug/metabolite transporter (DMT)-like permease
VYLLSVQKDHRRSTITGMAAVVMWSASLGLFRSISEIFGPAGGAALVFSCSGILAVAILGLPDVRTIRPAYLLGSGTLFVCYEISLALSVGFAHNRSQMLELGMINYLWPSLTVLFAVLTRTQRGSWLLVPAIGMCVAGIVCVMKGQHDLSFRLLWADMQGNPPAYCLAFGAAFLWAVYSVITRRYGQGENAVPLFLLVTAAVLWIKYAASDEAALTASVSGLAQVALLGTLTAAAYSCWNIGVQHGNLTLLATTSYFTPVLSACFASLWLGIRPGSNFMYGVAMVTAGSLICWWSSRARLAYP